VNLKDKDKQLPHKLKKIAQYNGKNKTIRKTMDNTNKIQETNN